MRILAAIAVISAGCASVTASGTPTQQATQRREADSTVIALWEEIRGSSARPASRPVEGGGLLHVFLPSKATIIRPAIIICPGGGYAFVSLSKEGTKIADRLTADGIAAFVLDYRLPKGRTPGLGELPAPEQDVLRAMQMVRSRAAEWKVDPNRIGVMGFSAGGHVAAMAATMFDDAKFLPVSLNDPIGRVLARPDFAILLYPVISMEPAWAHAGCREKLIGKTADAAMATKFSVDERVTAKMPPLFIAAARDDKTVQYHNAERMAAAADKARVPEKLMIFNHGGHGFGLGDNDETRTWYPACLAWLRQQRVLQLGDVSQN